MINLLAVPRNECVRNNLGTRTLDKIVLRLGLNELHKLMFFMHVPRIRS
jgi:hypothetical protein